MNNASISAALVSGKQETNLAGLATLNFDFSLIKVEPPSEYRALGACLSRERREAAESGPQNVTARKLGALFRFVGADGTSIWAAATSGREAILAHLLACMLARMWASHEAISIWHEIVETRRRVLERDAFDPVAKAASQATITRNQLADWDASARAWLQIADQAKARNQTQLMLIVQNFGLPVNTKKDLYAGVVEAWTQAMMAVDRAIQAIPQNVQSGAVLLGLTSWHIYPDILALESSSNEVIKQKDRLVGRGGLLTLGVKSCSPSLQTGIFWSLPLAYLRHYGDPVMVTKSLHHEAGYASMEDLALIALGSLFRAWKIPKDDFATTCKLISLLQSCLSEIDTKKRMEARPKRCPHWLNFLGKAANAFSDAQDSGVDIMLKRFSYGYRRWSGFLSDSPCESGPFRDIFKQNAYFSLLRTVEAMITFLRKVTSKIQRENPKCRAIIAYRQRSGDLASLATATPDFRAGSTNDIVQSAGQSSHHRWLSSRSTEERAPLSETWSILKYQNIRFSESYMVWLDPPEEFPTFCYVGDACTTEHSHPADRLRSIHDTRHPAYPENEQYQSESWYSVESYRLVQGLMQQYRPPTNSQDDFDVIEILPRMTLLRRCSGDASATLYTTAGGISGPNFTHPAELIELLTSQDLDRTRLFSAFNISLMLQADYLQSVRCLAIASKLYDHMPGAQVHLDVVHNTLCQSRWASSLMRSPRLAGADPGNFDSDPRDFTQAIALSKSNSLYVATEMLCDPTEESYASPVCRVQGNIGKAGLAILIPPPDSRSKEVDHNTMDVINHAPYDGVLLNEFEHTSLHLSLTDYSIPFTTEHKGLRDVEAFFQETVISIFDRADWVADLDVIRSLPKLSKPSKDDRVAPHQPDECPLASSLSLRSSDLPWKLAQVTSIDSWPELIDRPLEAAIVRSSGNWIGRLAAACLSAQKGLRTMVLSDEFCHRCRRHVIETIVERDRPDILIL